MVRLSILAIGSVQTRGTQCPWWSKHKHCNDFINGDVGVGWGGKGGNSDFIEVKDRSGGVITVCCQQIRETKAV